MKKWLIDTFLPMWAQQTVLADNKAMAKKIKDLQQQNKELSAYIRGLEVGIRSSRRVHICAGGKE